MPSSSRSLRFQLAKGLCRATRGTTHACADSSSLLLFLMVEAVKRTPPVADAAGDRDPYQTGSGSLPLREAQGRCMEFTIDHSTVFPGTSRAITVYVPTIYRRQTACDRYRVDALVACTAGVD